MALDVKWLALAGVLGAAGAVVAMRPSTPAVAPAASSAVSVAPAPMAPTVPANPWTDVPRSSAPGPAPATARVASTAPSDPNAPLDDAALAKRARETFGLDCPGVAQREPPRNGFFVITCGNGFRYRVYETPGQPPTISAPPTRVRARRAPVDDE